MPLVAVTVSAYVPVGVPPVETAGVEPLPPPLQPVQSKASKIKIPSPNLAFWRSQEVRKSIKASVSSHTDRGKPRRISLAGIQNLGGPTSDLAVVATVTVKFDGLAPTIRDEGETVQFVVAGALLQLAVTVPLKPFIPVKPSV
jgi:hypothetical protein